MLRVIVNDDRIAVGKAVGPAITDTGLKTRTDIGANGKRASLRKQRRHECRSVSRCDVIETINTVGDLALRFLDRIELSGRIDKNQIALLFISKSVGVENRV